MKNRKQDSPWLVNRLTGVFLLVITITSIMVTPSLLQDHPWMTITYIFGICLLIGLVLHDFWPIKLQVHLKLYCFFTLAYCIPLVNFLHYLYKPEEVIFTITLFGTLLGFSTLVRWKKFVVLSGIGLSVALSIYCLMENFPNHSLLSIGKIFELFFILGNVYFLGWLLDNMRQSKSKEYLAQNKLIASLFGSQLQRLLSAISTDELTRIIRHQQARNVDGEDGVFSNVKEYEQLIVLSSNFKRTKNEAAKVANIFESLIQHDEIPKEYITIRSVSSVIEGALHASDSYRKQVVFKETSTNFKIRIFPELFHHIIIYLVESSLSQYCASQVTISWDALHRKLYVENNGDFNRVGKKEDVFNVMLEQPSIKEQIEFSLVKRIVKAFGASIYMKNSKNTPLFTIVFPALNNDIKKSLT